MSKVTYFAKYFYIATAVLTDFILFIYLQTHPALLSAEGYTPSDEARCYKG